MRSHLKPLLFTTLAAIVVAGCSSSSSSSSSDGGGGSDGEPVGLAGSCVLNTDCNVPLTCDFGKCHEQCAESRDCPAGERCVESSGYGVCQLPAESTCVSGTTCPAPLVCAPDMTCRAACSGSGSGASGCLTNQVCVGGLCYDPGAAGDASSD